EYEEKIKGLVTPINQLKNFTNQTEARIGGIITQIQKVITRNNQPMLFVRLEDTSAAVEILVFPSLLKKDPTLWQEDKIVIIQGKISDKDGVIK
ncbi:OB-fold nucleic acid binding domain-containing protein, partial [Klebsiella variicola]|uniref:OB-fold nucleic acid binding domain-containing protein n=1 Tax=Klebsiella variicola TaxID=244366 RepID=UPI00272FB691